MLVAEQACCNFAALMTFMSRQPADNPTGCRYPCQSRDEIKQKIKKHMNIGYHICNLHNQTDIDNQCRHKPNCNGQMPPTCHICLSCAMAPCKANKCRHPSFHYAVLSQRQQRTICRPSAINGRRKRDKQMIRRDLI